MLRTDGRALLSEALAPPDGYELEVLVGTTYSLHLSALLSVPLSFTFADWEDAHGAPVSEPVASLEAVRRYADRITVFGQAGATAATEEPPLVASWLEDAVIPVRAPLDGVFHPKVWVARYRAFEDEPPAFRVLCLSRNLTFDRCWDTVLSLDGEPSARGGRVQDTKPLADFIEALPGLAVSSVTDSRRERIAALAAELRHVRFLPLDGCHGLAFVPLGIPRHTSDPFATRRSRMLVVAPFVGTGFLERLSTEKSRDHNILVSREDELEQLATAKLSHFGRLRTLDDLGEAQEESEDSGRLHGLHAKLYIAESGHDAHLWTGSANATTAALSKNVEFLVRLDGRRSVIGIDAVLGRPDEPTALARLLVDVEPREMPAEPELRVRLERELDDIAHDLGNRHVTAVVASGEIDYTVELKADPSPELPADVALRCWPLTDAGARHPEPITITGRTIARFHGLTLQSVTAFYVVELRLVRDECDVTKTFLLRATLQGLPPGRREAIMRELLADRDQVLRLLRALLMLESDGQAGAHLGFIAALGGGGGGGERYESPLLESMLRALADSPESIAAVASLVDEIRSVGDDLLPENFMAVWEPIAAVHAAQGDRRA